MAATAVTVHVMLAAVMHAIALRRIQRRVQHLGCGVGLLMGNCFAAPLARADEPGTAPAQAPASATPSQNASQLGAAGSTPEPLGFGEAYREWFGARRLEPRYGRAALEVVGWIGIGVAQYWLAAKSNSQDWDFPGIFERLTFEAVRFDNNTHTTNNLLHPLAGTAYYGFSRINGLNVTEAAIYTQLASVVWEYGLEWREKVSINDLVATPVGGIAIGEFAFRLADYLNSAPGPGGFGHRLAEFSFGAPVRIHRWIDDPPPPQPMPADNLGLSSAYWHEFRTRYEFTALANNRSATGEMHGLVLDAQLVAMPYFLKPKSFDVLFATGNFTEGHVALLIDSEGDLAEADVDFNSVLAGYYVQDMSEHGGHAAMAGVGTGIRFLDRSTLERGDQVSQVHFAGPTFGLWLLRGGLRASLEGRLHADFATIRSLTYQRAEEELGMEILKSTFQRGYQYHLGLFAQAKLQLDYQPARLSAYIRRGTYQSIEGLDREQEDVTLEFEGGEKLTDYGMSFAIQPGYTLLELSLSASRSEHESHLGPYSRERWEERLVAGLGLRF